MNARHEELFAGWFDAVLAPAEQEELLAALRADEALALAFAREIELHRGLQFSASRSEAGDRRAADRILHYVRASQEDTSFAERVNQRARRTSRSVPSGSSPFLPWLAAAAFVIAIVAAVVAFRREDAAPQQTVEQRRDPHVEKVARPPLRPVPPEAPKPAEDDAARRKRIEEELRGAAGTKRIETPPKREDPKPAPPEEKPVAVPEKPEPVKPEPTRVQSPRAIAKMESAQGEVELQDGATVETAGTAVVKFLDGTRVEISGEAKIHEKLAGKRASGKGITLARGTLAADVAKQPAGTAFLFVTPHAEVQVVGTRLSIQSGGETRVDVQEGQVRVTSHKGGQPVTLAAGQGSEVGSTGAPRPFSLGLQAFYFDLNTFKGQVVERVDPAIDLFLDEAKGELPPVGTDRNFAVRWQGRFLAEVAGEYAFILHVDGQARLAMDGENLVNEPRGVFHPGAMTTVRRKLAAGWHDLVLEYTDDSGSSRCGLRYVAPSAPMTADNNGYVIPPRLFTHNRR